MLSYPTVSIYSVDIDGVAADRIQCGANIINLKDNSPLFTFLDLQENGHVSLSSAKIIKPFLWKELFNLSILIAALVSKCVSHTTIELK